MSSLDKPREAREPRAPRTPRKPRARISLKMQAIGYLSRREHSRQELRAKLLDSLRKRAHEQVALAAAADKAAQELAQALCELPSNGIDDAFAPTAAEVCGRAAAGDSRETRASGSRTRTGARVGAQIREGDVDGHNPTAPRHSGPGRPALDTLSLASGAPLPVALKASLVASAAASTSTWASTPEITRRPVPTAASTATATLMSTPTPTPPKPLAPTHRVPAPEAWADVVDIDATLLDPACDDMPERAAAPLDATNLELTDPEAAVDELLDWLVANKYLSETRFVESRVNARSRKQGTLLIKLELSRHGLALEPEQAVALRESEFARALALWQRKFGAVAPDARLRAKQARFLAARGFAADVVRRIVGGQDED